MQSHKTDDIIFQNKFFCRRRIEIKEIHINNSLPGEDVSAYLNNVFDNISDDTTIIFETGTYFFKNKLLLREKNNVVLDGRSSILMPYYDNKSDYRKSSDVFAFEYCSNITLKNFKVSASQPANIGGKIVNVANNYVDVELFSSIELDGNERFLAGMAFTDNYCPLSIHYIINKNEQNPAVHSIVGEEIATTAPELVNARHERIDKNIWRIYTEADTSMLVPGMNCNVSHSYYGPAAFVFRSCKDVVIEAVHIANFGGFGYLILPECENFTFRNVRFQSDDRIHQPYSVTSDGIHTTGLGGKLVIEDSYFELVGDDCLNSHTSVLTVSKKEDNMLSLIFDKPNSIFPKRWTKTGDTLYVYDRKSLVLKCRIKVLSYKDALLLADDASEVNKGDFVINARYLPDITIKNTTITNSRSRICLQSANSVDIHDCNIDICPHLAAIYISAAFHYWGEAGSVKDVNIYNNKILLPSLKDAADVQKKKIAPPYGVYIKTEDVNSLYRYKNISIHNNKIDGSISVSSTDGISIKSNDIKTTGSTIEIKSCTDVEISDNKETIVCSSNL